MEYPLVSNNGAEKAEKMLWQLGYKPGQIFSHDDLEEKIKGLFAALKPEERNALIGRDCELAEDGESFFVQILLDDLCNSDVVQVHYRFLPEDEKVGVLQKLRELCLKRR